MRTENTPPNFLAKERIKYVSRKGFRIFNLYNSNKGHSYIYNDKKEDRRN